MNTIVDFIYNLTPWVLSGGIGSAFFGMVKPDRPAWSILGVLIGFVYLALLREWRWYRHRNDPRIEFNHKANLIIMHLTPEWASKLGLPPINPGS